MSESLNKHVLDKTNLTYEQLGEFLSLNVSKCENGWICYLCSTTANQKQDIERHIEAKHCILPRLSCNICGKSSKNRQTLTKHMSYAHNKRYWRWNLCNMSLAKHDLSQALKNWTTRSCFILMKHFFYLDQTHLTYEQLDEFVTLNSSRDKMSNKLVCHICSTTATTRQNMENHIEARHCVLPPLLCTICNKQAKTRNSLAKHMGTYHKWSMINRRFCVIV